VALILDVLGLAQRASVIKRKTGNARWRKSFGLGRPFDGDEADLPAVHCLG